VANVIEILINAKNNATAEFEKSAGSLAKFTTAAGLAGAAGAMAGQAIVTAMQNAQRAIIDNTLKMADNVEMLDRMAGYTGLSVQQLDLFRQKLEEDGLSSDQLSQALRYLREQLNSGDQKLAAFGITSRDTFTALQQMAAAMQRARDVGERADISTAALGQRNAELAASVAQAANTMNTLQAEALRNGTALTDDYLTKMRELDSSMDQFAKTQKSFGMAMAELFQPAIKGSVDFLNKINEINRGMAEMDSRINKVPGLRQGPTLFSAHSGFDYSNTNFSGGGGGGGGGAPAPAGRATVWARPWDQGAAGMGIMATLPTLVVSMAEILKRMTGAAGGGIGGESSKTTDAITKPLDSVHQAALRFGANIEGAFRTAFSNVLNITTTSTNAVVQLFTALANGILQTVSDMLAEAAARGLIDLALSFIPGGDVASKVGKLATKSTMSAGRGGDTYVIQSFDSRSTMQELVNPTGSFRRANDRLRDIAIAQAG